MKRREFLKSTLFFAAISTLVGKTAGLLNDAIAAVVYAAPGKLGYKEKSDKLPKQCSTCKHYKLQGAEKGAGLCTLPAMMSTMKTKEVYVKEAAYCNMWAKKA